MRFVIISLIISILSGSSLVGAADPIDPKVYLTKRTADYLHRLGTYTYHVVGFIPLAELALALPVYELSPQFYVFIYNLDAIGTSTDMMDFFVGHEVGHTVCHKISDYLKREHCADLAAVRLTSYDVVWRGLGSLIQKYPDISMALKTRKAMLVASARRRYHE